MARLQQRPFYLEIRSISTRIQDFQKYEILNKQISSKIVTGGLHLAWGVGHQIFESVLKTIVNTADFFTFEEVLYTSTL